jgi:hypothetical protein
MAPNPAVISNVVTEVVAILCSLRGEERLKEHEGDIPSADVKTHVGNGAGAPGETYLWWNPLAEPSNMVKVTGCFTHNGSKNRASRSMNTPCPFLNLCKQRAKLKPE